MIENINWYCRNLAALALHILFFPIFEVLSLIEVVVESMKITFSPKNGEIVGWPWEQDWPLFGKAKSRSQGSEQDR